MKRKAFRIVLVLALAITAAMGAGCRTTDNGTVNVVVNKGMVESVMRPANGFFTTASFWRHSYGVDMKTFTEKADNIKVFSRDNTPIILESVQLTAHTTDSDETITAYVQKFGLDNDERHTKRLAILDKNLETEARKAFNKFDAYDIYSNLGGIQQALFDGINPILRDELFLTLESVQFGNWHFENPAIEQAASAVVANRKQKEAETAAYEAAKTRKQTQDLQALVFKDPNLFKLEQLKLQLQIEQARAQGVGQHQGPLTLIYGQQPAAQLMLGQDR